MRKYFGLVDRFVSVYAESVTGSEVFERMKVERKQHRRAVRLAALGREEMDFDKHCYPRDRIWNWKGRGEEEEEEEEDNENGSDSDGQFELTRRPTARSSCGAGSRTDGWCK